MEEIKLEEVIDKLESAIKPIIEEIKKKHENGSAIIYKGNVSNKIEMQEQINKSITELLIWAGYPSKD
jgi:Zn-dependent M32 family carboxypeptidase